MRRFTLVVVLTLMPAALLSFPAHAQSPAEFYKGKQISLYIGFSPGGGYDIYARTLARHMGRHVPGNPQIVARNMDGAGSLRAANYTYQVAPRDGTAIAAIGRASVVAPLFGQSAAQFDARNFTWLGSANDEVSVCVVRSGSGINTFDDLKKRTVSFGATGPAEEGVQMYKAMNALLGTHIRIISGYPGSNEMSLAIERGELDGRCALSWSSMKAAHQAWLDQKLVTVLTQVSFAKHPDLPHVPLLIDLAPDDESRQILKFLAARQVMGRPYFGPPEVPPDRVAALQKAFMETLNDREFRAEADRQRLEINPVPASRINALLKELYAMPAPIIEKAATLFN